MSEAPRSGRRRLATALTAAGLAALVATGSVLAGTPVTNGYRDHSYAGGAFRPNGDKPQSKVWYTDEGGGQVQWWAGMFWFTASPPRSENRIWRLSADKTTWTPQGNIVDQRDNSHADYLWDEATNTLYVMSVAMPNNTNPFVVPATADNVRFFKYTYNPTTNAYTQVAANVPVAGTASTASPAFRGGAWTVTIDKDSTGRLWAIWPQGTEVRYSYSDTDGASWTEAAPLPAQAGNSIKSEIGASAVSRSDSASVITFGSPTKDTIGVMWSDQDDSGATPGADNGYYFATIAAGQDPAIGANWTKVELPKLALLTNDEADNHINMKTTSDGTVYMVGKTRAETAQCATNKNKPNIPFFRRTPGGVWTTYLVATVGDCDTRPQVVISEQLDTAYVFLTSPNGGGAIYRRSAPITGPDAFVFRGAPDQTSLKGVAFIKSATETLIDDATTTKQPVTSASGIVVNANNLISSTTPNQKFFLHNWMPLPATDSAYPTGSVTINAGAAVTTNPAVSVAVPATDNPAVNSGLSLVRLANSGGTDGNGVLNGSGATSFLYTTPIAWTVSAGDGTKTVFAQWRDAAGNWSTPISDDIVLDTTGPTGSVEINGGDPTTNSILVTLGLTATDAGAGVASVLIANDTDNFTGVTPVPFAATVQHQLSSGLGPKTVYVRFIDAAGNISATSVSDGITLQLHPDATPPNPVSAVSHIVAGTGQTSIPVRISWTAGTDNPGGSGVAGYVIQRQVNGGAFATVATVNHPTLSYQANLSTSSATYRYRVLVKDKGRGLTSSGKYTPTFRTLSYSESSSSVHYTGAWSLSSSPIYVGGKARWGQAANASASLTFTGNRIGWLSRTGPIYGTARVYINGSLASTVNLYSATYLDRRIVFQRSFSTTAARTIRIVISGTAGHPRVTLDQFFVLR